jgi:hypothetical protein
MEAGNLLGVLLDGRLRFGRFETVDFANPGAREKRNKELYQNVSDTRAVNDQQNRHPLIGGCGGSGFEVIHLGDAD